MDRQSTWTFETSLLGYGEDLVHKGEALISGVAGAPPPPARVAARRAALSRRNSPPTVRAPRSATLSRAGKVYRTSNGRQNTFLKVESGGKADLTLSRFLAARARAGTTYPKDITVTVVGATNLATMNGVASALVGNCDPFVTVRTASSDADARRARRASSTCRATTSRSGTSASRSGSRARATRSSSRCTTRTTTGSSARRRSSAASCCTARCCARAPEPHHRRRAPRRRRRGEAEQAQRDPALRREARLDVARRGRADRAQPDAEGARRGPLGRPEHLLRPPPPASSTSSSTARSSRRGTRGCCRCASSR